MLSMREKIESTRRMQKWHQVIVGQKRASKFNNFARDWEHCQRCPLSTFRSRVVQFRGIIPAKVCFIGEAPGVSEDEKGLPFVGPAGDVFDELVDQAGMMDGDFCLINTTGCIPYPPGDPIASPENDCVKACIPRVEGLIEMIEPKLVVALGRIAASWTKRLLNDERFHFIDLIHPAAILYQRSKSPTNAATSAKRFVLTLKLALTKL